MWYNPLESQENLQRGTSKVSALLKKLRLWRLLKRLSRRAGEMDEIWYDMIKRHEGFRRFPYECTSGKLTIGYGRNIEERGITKEEADFLFRNDVKISIRELAGIFPNFIEFKDKQKAVLTDLMFNLGYSRFIKFKKMVSAIKDGNWIKAANEMRNSKWYVQVGRRGAELVNLLLEED